MTTYSCTKCQWSGSDYASRTSEDLGGAGTSYPVCPKCGFVVIDLDVAERPAIHEDAHQGVVEEKLKMKEPE